MIMILQGRQIDHDIGALWEVAQETGASARKQTAQGVFFIKIFGPHGMLPMGNEELQEKIKEATGKEVDLNYLFHARAGTARIYEDLAMELTAVVLEKYPLSEQEEAVLMEGLTGYPSAQDLWTRISK